jgi:hypothetical protein
MKRTLGVVAVLAATTVSAAEVKFGDLNYFLTQGRSQVSFDTKWDTTEVTQKNNPGQTTTETEGPIAHAKFAFALNDSLNIFVGANYVYENQVKPEGGTRFQKDGLQNPALGLNLRVMNQANAGINLDLGAVAKVGITDEVVGSSNGGNKKSGNASERSSLELNARIGNKWDEANEFYVVGGFVYNQSGERTLKNASGTDQDQDLDASYDFILSGFYQYRPVNEFMMTLGLESKRTGSVEGDSNGTNFEYTDFIETKWGFAAKYLITDTFIVRFDYGGDLIFTDSKNKIDGAADQKFENHRLMTMGLGAEIIF